MLKQALGRVINVPAMLRHVVQTRATRVQARSSCELELYRRMFGSEFLHLGYFEDPSTPAEEISLHMLINAMQDYAELVLRRIDPECSGQHVVDIGCGLGGLLRMLRERGLDAHGVTPNAHHARLIRERHPDVTVHLTPFQDLDSAALRGKFDFATSTEALHAVPIDAAFAKLKEVVKPGGRLILIDYFRLSATAKSRSGWLLDEFEAALARHGVEVLEMTDIGPNVLPTMKVAHLWATRLVVPLIEFNLDRFLLDRPVLSYLLQPQRRKLQDKLDALESIDPTVLAREKCYRLYQLRLPA